jgi:hypothetical protein
MGECKHKGVAIRECKLCEDCGKIVHRFWDATCFVLTPRTRDLPPRSESSDG